VENTTAVILVVRSVFYLEALAILILRGNSQISELWSNYSRSYIHPCIYSQIVM
jgi:hypothetical protein